MSTLNSIINITNLSGNMISTITTINKQDQEIIDIRDWQAGLYIATLKSREKLIKSVKFTIAN